MDLSKVSSKLELLRLAKGTPTVFIEAVWNLIQKERRENRRLVEISDDNEDLTTSLAALEQAVAEMRGML